MIKGETFGIRLKDEERRKLDRMAKAYDVKVTQIIVWAIRALVEHAERHDGKLTLPINFDDPPVSTLKKHPCRGKKGATLMGEVKSQAVA